MDIDTLTKEDQGSLDHLSTVEIRLRLNLVTSVLLEARAKGDVRWKNLIPQQRKLNAVLVARIKIERGTEIAPTVVNMQSACLIAKAQRS